MPTQIVSHERDPDILRAAIVAWFERGARGYDLFERTESKPPHELGWLVYRRTPAATAQQPEATRSRT